MWGNVREYMPCLFLLQEPSTGPSAKVLGEANAKLRVQCPKFHLCSQLFVVMYVHQSFDVQHLMFVFLFFRSS